MTQGDIKSVAIVAIIDANIKLAVLETLLNRIYIVGDNDHTIADKMKKNSRNDNLDAMSRIHKMCI